MKRNKILPALLLAALALTVWTGCDETGIPPESVTVERSVPQTEPLSPDTSAVPAPVTTQKPPETAAPAVTDPVTEPVTEPMTEPVTEPMTEPATEPMTEPATEPTTEHVTEPITGPETETVTGPVTDPVVTVVITEPVTDAPVTAQKPPVTQAPVTTQKPQETKAPVTTQKPQETKAPVTTQKPQETKAPVTTQKPQETKAPVTTQKPPVTQAPVTTAPKSDAPIVIPTILEPTAPGTAEKRVKNAVIDYSNANDGYVMVQYLAAAKNAVKVQIEDGTEVYTYTIPPQKWISLPLSSGNKTYKVTVFAGVTATKFATIVTVNVAPTLTSDRAPFLRPSLLVNYSEAPDTVYKAAELTRGMTRDIDKITAIYDYVTSTMTYDYAFAASAQSGYVPDLDAVLKKKSGICYDYAALMCGMLRSQGIPCKMIHGYVSSGYHAWLSVWTAESGWIDKYIYFDGKNWKRMDPTFASTGGRNQSTMDVIGNDAGYTQKYCY